MQEEYQLATQNGISVGEYIAMASMIVVGYVAWATLSGSMKIRNPFKNNKSNSIDDKLE